ncbi:hypothetical protein [Maribacter algarum]|uniref:hypothetical protein n=1 Tax=Maribacter algarum (ex Zhang et al. 2020) TaxID=2578118 RepID=UPI0014872891|nr:hypothetical protein [Maribacter algarum]
MKDKNKRNVEAFMLTLGICATIAGIGLMISGSTLVGMLGSISGAFLIIYGYNKNKAS